MSELVNNGRIKEVTEDMGNLILPPIYILGNGDKSMKIEKMMIDNINGIKHLDLTFNKGLNLICGENGVGKTTVLRSVAQCFLCGENNYIKKYYNSENGIINVKFDNGETESFSTSDFDMEETDNLNTSVEAIDIGDHIIYFPTFRTIEYRKLDALYPISSKGDGNIHSLLALNSGVQENIKSWFVNRLIFSQTNYSLNSFQLSNLYLSQNAFQLLDKQLSIKTATPDFELIMTQGKNEIYFEMLSDGYKSSIFILLGLIKEIEYRFPETNAIDFDGIIMIDEIDIHLHPQWQAKLVKVLKETFPKAQIIATTHSPSVLQNATSEEIIPLYKDENGDVHIKELHLGEYGLQGWTLEEIMKDVMGMESTTSDLYTETIHKFDLAMNNEDQTEILKNYEMLKQMLHPESTMLQLLKIQVSEWKN